MPRTLDHFVLCVSGLEQARAGYRALGFTLTPPATHPFGTRNSLVQFQGRNFLELLALDEGGEVPAHDLPHRLSFGAHNRNFLRHYGEGMSMLAFAGSDARADVKAFRESGLVTFEPFDFGRRATLPDGQVAEVAFSLAFVTHPDMPSLAFFSSQQRHAPAMFWRPEYQHHANGAEKLVEVIMSASEPAAFGDFFGRLTDGPVAADDDGGGIRVGSASDRISVLTPARLRERFPELDGDVRLGREHTPSFVGYRVAVADVLAVRRILDHNAIPHRVAAKSLVVSPGAAHGVAIEFSE
ncbi:MAG TPA: VOC family protein [Acetobacteraceae bacterium]|nr:VOC family protein [Acetobacteraceae bacterium]